LFVNFHFWCWFRLHTQEIEKLLCFSLSQLAHF
jgi:hypothetical protein